MSRIGRKPIPVPAGVKVQLSAAAVEVQGPKGKLNVPLPRGIRFEQKDGVLNALRETEEHARAARLGAGPGGQRRSRRHRGFKKDLDIVGVGYRAELKGKNVVFALGYSHPVEFPIPEGIQIAVEKQTHLTVSGRGPRPGGPGGGEYPRPAPARPVQAEGHPPVGERLKKKAGKAGAPRPARLDSEKGQGGEDRG